MIGGAAVITAGLPVPPSSAKMAFAPMSADGSLFTDVVDLVHEAGNPYFDWFFGDEGRASAAVAAWMHRAASEISSERIAIARVDGQFVGLFVALAGTDVHRCRLADALALVETAPSDEARSALRERMEAARGLFPPPGADEYYLSKVAVARSHRRKGFGRALVDAFLSAGRSSGFRRFRVDVSVDNEPALSIYRAARFVVESEHEAAGIRYQSMVLQDDSGGERGSTADEG